MQETVPGIIRYPSTFASQIMKNVTRGTTIDQKWDRAGPGGWQGVPTNQPKCEKTKNERKRKHNK